VSGRHFLTSLTRISDLAERSFDTVAVPRDDWSNGDYVAAEVLSRQSSRRVELASGRMIEMMEGDLLVGALGRRFATLEATGTFEEVGEDGRMSVLGGGGILGKCTSQAMGMGDLLAVRYAGHVKRSGRPVRMADFAVRPDPEISFDLPVVLVIGSSMSAGKTTAARIIVNRLKRAGLGVLGAKVTGAGRYRDALAMWDAGADHVLDFVDAGLPSSICPEEEEREALAGLMSKMGSLAAGVAVVEVGASPLEPYNGMAASEVLREHAVMTVLCASDPYAVVGVMEAYGDGRPDLVTGITSNTLAGVALVERLTGVRTLNIRDKAALPELDRLLRERLELPGGVPPDGAAP